ncbi:MAG: phosphate ABC transporter permease PstA [Spirochaetota bacterium]|nr:phosphate ABC transporter permease PstA [Spirochaetota bacterium]
MIISAHTRKTKRQERIAKGFIWSFVILTIVILAWIILYVLFRGFYFRNEVNYDVTDMKEQQIILNEDVEPVVFIVHPGVRLDDLTMQELRTIYTKARKEKWGPYTQQDLRVETFVLPSGTAFTDTVNGFIEGPEEEINKYATTVADPQSMIEKVASTKGAIGYIPASAAEGIGKKVKVASIRRISAVVHPSVKEIVNNVQMQELTPSQLEEIFRGEIQNWQEVGGIDLQVRPILPPKSTPYSVIHEKILPDGSLPAEVLQTDSFEEFCNAVKTTPGAVGLCFYNNVIEGGEELYIEEIRRIESGANLTIHYLIEAPARSGAWGGISTIIINTFFLILFTLLFSTPIGVLGAIYLVEYAKQGRLVRILRLGTETLAGIPSIVFGLFGSIFFVNMLGLGIGFISATLTVTMMILPTIIRTTEEALKAVPISFREGSLALGATKLQTIARVVIPAASPGILTGIILAVGRTVGETAVLIYTLGSNYELVRGPSSSARVLSLHLYNMFAEAISFDRTFATGAILIFIVLLVNYSTTKMIGRMNKMAGK